MQTRHSPSSSDSYWFISHNELIALLDRADIYVYCALVEIEGLLLQTLRNYRRK